MWTYDSMGTCVLVLTLLTILVMVLLLRQRRTQKDAPVWLLSAVVGILLGAAGAAAAVQLLGYRLVTSRAAIGETGDAAGGSGTTAPSMGSGTMGPGAPGGMGGGMGGGGMRAPSPKRELTTLVRKINLLTGDIALTLKPEQAASLAKLLQSIQAKEKMTDDEAKATQEELLALFDADQKAKQDAIGLPFRRGGGGGPGGPGGAPGGPGGGPGGPGGGPGGPGGGPPADENANPFKQEQNAEAIQSLLARFGTPGSKNPTGDKLAADKAAKDKPAADKAAKDKPTDPPAPTAPATKAP